MGKIIRINKDLGSIVCGETVAEYLEVENERNICRKLAAVEESDSGGFSITPQALEVSPGKKARFKITFVSYNPNVVYANKFVIYDGGDVVAEFAVRCKSLGPSVMPKNFGLKFFILKNVKLDNKRLEIENKSICPTKFQFERMGSNLPFLISQESGILHARGKFILDIKFAPSQLGVYSKKIHCLLQYHEPLVFTLVGVYNPRLKINRNIPLSLRLPPEEPSEDNYEAYMKNLNEDRAIEEIDPCVDLSPATKVAASFDADNANEEDASSNGAADEESRNFAGRSISQVVLTNYFLNMGKDSSLSGRIKLVNISDSEEFFFEWSNDNGKCFSITPKSGNLKESQKLDLKIDFSPELPDRLYHGELDVRIFPVKNECEAMSPEIITLPTTLSLSIVGHSFGTEGAGWSERCEVEPKQVAMPPCAPGQVVYSTLLIKRLGRLPAAFEFFPPEKSCIKIKPPSGYITSAYQLCIVQFDASAGPYGNYTETWRVSYNHKTKYFDRIRITVNVENPTIILGSDNAFKFHTVLPGGISKVAVSIRNPTSLRLRYEFFIPKHIDWIKIPALTGELDPLSASCTDVIFKPMETKEYSDYICCSTKTVKTPEYKSWTRIELEGSCQDGFLVATPDHHDFGKCLCGTEQRKKFKVFNFTPVLMHFELCVINEGIFNEFTNNIIKLFPDKGSILGKSNIEVEIAITPNLPELSKHIVRCKLLASDPEHTSTSPFPDARTLFTLEIEGTLPTFQIIDLNIEGGGPLVSPDWLWKMMDVNGLNKILREIRSGEEKGIDIRLPEAVVDSSPLIIHVLVEAKNLHGMFLKVRNIHRSHFCGRPSWTTASDGEEFNFMTFAPSEMHFEPLCRRVLKIAVTFEVTGASIYGWSLFLSQNRVVNLRTIINALSKDDALQTSMYLGPDMTFKSVFVGDLAPPVQLFWLYNNTPSPTSYIVDKASLRDSTPPFPKIFDCLNPNGILPPFSCLPLIFAFRPNEFKLYKASTHLCLKSDHAVELNLTGTGTVNYSHIAEFGHEQTIPETSILHHDYIALEPSAQVFTVKPFPTFSNIRRIFFLKNISKENVWAFRWHSFTVKDILNARVEPGDGKIEPGGKLLLTLIVKSFQHPTNITFSVPCDVIDYTALENYEKSLKLKEKMDEMYKDYFTITEDGLFNEVPEVKVLKKPKLCHIFVAVRTNIVGGESIENKLSPKLLQTLQNGKEAIPVFHDVPTIKEDIGHVINETVEKILWKILYSTNFNRQLANYRERFGKATYLQVLPGAEKQTEQIAKRLRTSLPKYHVEYLLENTIIDILRKNVA